MSDPSARTRSTLLGRLRDLSDQESWGTFERDYSELILRFALRSGIQREDAEDVRQTVFLSLARALPGFQYCARRGSFRNYLRTIVRNAVWEHLRRRESGAEPLSSDVPEPAPFEGEDAWSQEWRRHHYRMGMQTLREDFHAGSLAIFDELLAGTDPQAVAERHGVTPEVVYKVKQRVRDRLREVIQKQIADEEDPGERA